MLLNDQNATRSLLLRAFSLSSCVVIVVGALCWVIGAAPAGLEGYLGVGVGAAIFAGAMALWVNGVFLQARPHGAADGAILASRLQGLLAAAFAVKLVVLVIGMYTLHRLGAKFAATATFCIAFASASLIYQLLSAGYVSRSLGSRPRAIAAASAPRSGGGKV